MSKFLNDQELISIINENKIIINGDIKNVDNLKYDFRLSPNILKAKYGTPINLNNIKENERHNYQIESGEVVFVLTEESVMFPDNLSAILIPKRKLSHDGIMIMGGLSIDPGYSGKLLIGLYNFSSSPFPLIPGKKLIAAKFYKLDEDEIPKKVVKTEPINDFPDELRHMMKNYQPISLLSIQESISKVDLKIESVKDDFKKNNEWFEKFQQKLEDSEKQISRIAELLKTEVDDRKSKDTEIRDDLKMLNTELRAISKDLYKNVGIVAIVVIVIGAILSILSKLIN